MSLLSRTSTVLGIGLGLSFTMNPLSPLRASPMQCQYSAPYYRTEAPAAETGWGVPADDHLLSKQGKTRPGTSAGGFLTKNNMKQVSFGSVLGLVAGVGLRAFSRVLVVLIGMGFVFVEWAASKGYNIVPVNRLQRYVKNTDLQRALSKYAPFKVTFGLTMSLAAFAQF
ncbi:uncharacterized protein ACHE_21370S [Aspergillus chevalieri]|uniref:FUN14 family protein n=1 Tax=Aspergillus chevalieri TaxID=182096 RepID=A0A7R7VK47_ASPCH|nr:uncharacterized protein ACHE_21370S [Aspergillus chevalieri]BCR85912.1 hypothetical protein ACHE_21370S [Aspergillus chevalieri]